MPSPLPGMDPYLEHPALWPEFHRHLLTTLRQVLLPGLVDRYRAAPQQRRYSSATSQAAEEHQEEYLVIRQRSDHKLVTLLDVVSPANKTTAEGRQAYLETRREARDSG